MFAMMARIDISTYIPVFRADLNLKKVCSVGGEGALVPPMCISLVGY